jgi:hypothetical protein
MAPRWQTCPGCGQSQQVYKVSSLQERIASQRWPVTPDALEALSPPPKPKRQRLTGYLAGLGLCVLALSIVVLAWQSAAYRLSLPFTIPDGWTQWAIGGALAGLGMLLAELGYGLAASARLAVADMRWRRAKQRWERLYYCQACRGVFEAGEGKLVPLEAMRQYLYSTEQ